MSAGAHVVSETAAIGDLADYVTTISGDCAADGSITLSLGDDATCTITNLRRATIIVEKQTIPDGAPGTFTFTGDAAGDIGDGGTITVDGLDPTKAYSSTEADPTPQMFDLVSISCDDGGSASPSTGDLATRTATFNVEPGEVVTCVFTNAKMIHPGTIGFWRNWNNHYSPSQMQLIIDQVKADNPTVYNADPLNPADDYSIAVHNAILDFGKKTPREQMILAQLTATKDNLAITKIQGPLLTQKNDDICLDGVLDVSGIGGAEALFGSDTPTIGDVVAVVEAGWTGTLSTNRNTWSWSFSKKDEGVVITTLTGINEGTIVLTTGC